MNPGSDAVPCLSRPSRVTAFVPRLVPQRQSIIAFGTLWGLVACHSYGPHGMRVSFPVRQMLRLLSQSISRNIERLSYAQRLHTRKLVRPWLTSAYSGGDIDPSVYNVV